MTIKLATRQAQDVTVLDASGRLTLGEDVTGFRDKIQGLLAEGQKKLLLNLAEISYMDSSGIGALIAASTSATKQGGKVKLLSPTKRVHELLQITKTDSLFDVFTDEGAALASF